MLAQDYISWPNPWLAHGAGPCVAAAVVNRCSPAKLTAVSSWVRIED
jgi:hypothetical protein